jgi:hypothetical protein
VIYQRAIEQGIALRFAFPGFVRRLKGKGYGAAEKAKVNIL